MPAKSLREPTSHPLIIKADDYEEIVKKDFSNISLLIFLFYFCCEDFVRFLKEVTLLFQNRVESGRT